MARGIGLLTRPKGGGAGEDAPVARDGLARFKAGQRRAVEVVVEGRDGEPFGLGPAAARPVFWALQEAIGGEGDADKGGCACICSWELFDAADAALKRESKQVRLALCRSASASAAGLPTMGARRETGRMRA